MKWPRKKLEIRGNVIEGRLLEGEEEQKYWNEEVLPRLENSLTRGGRASGRARGRARGGKRDRSRSGGRGRGGDGAKRRKFEHPPKE